MAADVRKSGTRRRLRSFLLTRREIEVMPKTAPSVETGRDVLVVEDEPQICELLADVLRAEDYEPVCVEHDEPAFAALRSETDFACMIVDVNLGVGTTGYDVAR